MDDDDDDDVEDNFECPSLGSNTFLVIYFQTIVINLPSSIKGYSLLRAYRTAVTWLFYRWVIWQAEIEMIHCVYGPAGTVLYKMWSLCLKISQHIQQHSTV